MLQRETAANPSPPPSRSQLQVDDLIRNMACLMHASFFPSLCFDLAGRIDRGIRENVAPSDPHNLFRILKQMCQLHKEPKGLSAIMVLMISVKNACRHRWFQAGDSKELLAMADEISRSFNMGDNIVLEASDPEKVIYEIIHRYYPKLTSDYLFSSFEVKPGYSILVSTFDFTKDLDPPQSMRLLVVQKDNVDTSACLVTPPQVSFLINGKYVEGRTNALMDSGPQLPTDITRMVKKGVNLFQAIGSFYGNYVIAMAAMSPINISDVPALQDYVQLVTPADKSDFEVIEDASRISLNCPISFQRLKLPVKGHLCKHSQCFDYGSFIDMNSRKPTWRCPLCNQPVSYVDIRIDQDMVKILREVGESITDVIILNDGSWKMMEQHDNASSLQKITNENGHNGHKACKNGDKEITVSEVSAWSDGASNTPVIDLTMEVDQEPRVQDWKPCPTAGPFNFLSDYVDPETTLTNTQNTIRMCTGMPSQICPSLVLNRNVPCVSAAQNPADFVPFLDTPQYNFFRNPVLPTINQAGSDFFGMQHSTSSMQNVPSTSASLDNLQSQQMDFRKNLEQPVLPSVGSMVTTSCFLANAPGVTYNQRPQASRLGPTYDMPSSSLFPFPVQSYPQLTLMGNLPVPRTSNIASASSQLPRGTQIQPTLPRQVHHHRNYPLQTPFDAAMVQDQPRSLPHLNKQNLYPQRSQTQTLIQASPATMQSQPCNMIQTNNATPLCQPQAVCIGMTNLELMDTQAHTTAHHAAGFPRSSRGSVSQVAVDNIRPSSGTMLQVFDCQVARPDGLPGSSRGSVSQVAVDNIRPSSGTVLQVFDCQVTRPDGLPGSTDWQGATRMRGCLTGNEYFEALRRYTSQPMEGFPGKES